MRPLTCKELTELMKQVRLSSKESRDELLTDLLVATYPTKVTQNN